jgi:ribosomal-protein-alanine N-acetyltransferase
MIIIRSMTSADCKAAAELEKEIFSQPWSEQGFLDAIAMDGNIFLVAEEAGEICGYIGMYVSLDEGEITNVAVAPNKRGAGVGGLLLQETIEFARKRDIVQIVLEVRVSNQPAIHLYEKYGFEHCGIRRGFYDFPKEDAYIMMLRK